MVVPVSTRERLPVEAVRDLLGIARALYAAAKAEDAGRRHLEEIATAGRELRRALDLAERTPPGSMGHRAAWTWASRGYERLVAQLSLTTALLPVVEAAAARAGVRLPKAAGDRDDERRAQRVRR
jgi:hypothetical protein